MKALLNIVAGLLLLVQSYKVKKEQEHAQSQANDINKDPTDWFNAHFDGGLSNDTNATEASPGKATHPRINSKQSDVYEPTGRK